MTVQAGLGFLSKYAASIGFRYSSSVQPTVMISSLASWKRKTLINRFVVWCTKARCRNLFIRSVMYCCEWKRLGSWSSMPQQSVELKSNGLGNTRPNIWTILTNANWQTSLAKQQRSRKNVDGRRRWPQGGVVFPTANGIKN